MIANLRHETQPSPRRLYCPLQMLRRTVCPGVGQKQMLDVCPMRGMEPRRVESDSEPFVPSSGKSRAGDSKGAKREGLRSRR